MGECIAIWIGSIIVLLVFMVMASLLGERSDCNK